MSKRKPVKKELQIDIIEYKSSPKKSKKSRVGKYWIIKKLNKKGKIENKGVYKYDRDIPIDIIAKEFIDVYYNQKKGKRKSTIKKKKTNYRKKQQQEYRKKLEKQPTIKSKIKKGYEEIETITTKGYDNKKITELTKKLLSPLVQDKQFLEELVKPENIKKEAYRLEYQITILDEKGNTIATTKTFNQTPQDVLNTLQHEILYNFVTSTKYKEDEMTTLLQLNGFVNNNIEKTGQARDFRIKTIVRKG